MCTLESFSVNEFNRLFYLIAFSSTVFFFAYLMVFQYENEQKYDDFHSLDQEESRYFQYNSQNQ